MRFGEFSIVFNVGGGRHAVTDTRITGRGHNARNAGRFGEPPSERVFAAAAADNKNLQPIVSPAKIMPCRKSTTSS